MSYFKNLQMEMLEQQFKIDPSDCDHEYEIYLEYLEYEETEEPD
ncbi:MAG: hypothetical protein OQK51_24370 [Kangiellaceae bacterium]|nr:hypothetical protein [Kangiellaceae bacterium]